MDSVDSRPTVNAQKPLQEAIRQLVRGSWADIESSLVTYGEPTTLTDTQSTVRCHFLRSNANGDPRLQTLVEQLADQIIDYCIPRKEIEAIEKLPQNRKSTKYAHLYRESTGLFTQTQVTTGEGAELLLYVLLEKGLQVPQILNKMSLKTSTEMQYHGADGVHAKFLDNGDLAVYWGEAKLYESVSQAMTSCMNSIAPYLTGSAYEQDLFLIRHHADTGNSEITAQLLEYFDNGSILSANVEMRGACLIGFAHKDYPSLRRDEDMTKVKEELDSALNRWADSMRERLMDRSLTKYTIEVFFIPLPSVEDFRQAIKQELRI